MNKILDSKEYKRMEKIVLNELQLKLLEAKIEDRNYSYYSQLNERELILSAGLGNYFNNFHMRFPDWPGPLNWSGKELRKAGINPLDNEETIEYFKLKRRIKKLIGEVGLNRIKVKELVLNFYKGRNKEHHLSFIDYTFSVYVALRMEGYKHYPDLIG